MYSPKKLKDAITSKLAKKVTITDYFISPTDNYLIFTIWDVMYKIFYNKDGFSVEKKNGNILESDTETIFLKELLTCYMNE